MRKTSKQQKINRKCHTEQAQTYYPQHLILKRKRAFSRYPFNPEESIQLKRQSFHQQTNFGFTATNQFIFILLHLRSRDNKNTLNINIPQVCVFVDKLPYDIFYSQAGFIRGFRSQQSMKCRLRDLQLFYKQTWKKRNLGKNQHISAIFKQKQVLILSQTDFTIVCKKIKSDSFFKRLQYIQNKLPYVGQQIISEYDYTIKQQAILKLVTQSLLGYKNQKQLLNELGQQKYLNFLNQKIALALNYQHNIRIIKANFHYVKNQNNEYFLVNVTNLHLNNLTKALQLRQQKLKKLQQKRDQLLILTPQKQRKFKSYQKPKEVANIQNIMKQNFESIVKRMNFMSISESKHQEIKNELAFKKLHPEIKKDYHQLISQGDFKKTKQKLFGTTLNGRKPISIPSKYVLRSYNKVKRSYTMFSQQDDQTLTKTQFQ